MTLREWIDKFKQEIEGPRWRMAISIFMDHIFMNPQYHNRCVPTEEYVDLLKENLRILGERVLPNQGWTTVSIMMFKNEDYQIYSAGGIVGTTPYSAVFLPEMSKGVLALFQGGKMHCARFTIHALSTKPDQEGNGKPPAN